VEKLNREKLNRLVDKSGASLISIYMPTHRMGRERQQDPIRFKNLLAEAEKRLLDRGIRRPEVVSQLECAHALRLDTDFWQHQSDGLAVFTSVDYLEYYRLPLQFAPLLVIADRLHLKPLLPLLSRNGHYYLLALSQKQVRLLEGSLFGVDELDLQEVPSSLREALRFDDPERQLQYHTGTNAAGAVTGRPAVFHGQGVSKDDGKIDLLRFFQKVNNGIMEMLAEEQAPLVLAGVDYLLPIYKEANQYPYLVEEGIEGNPDELDAAQLHLQAWKIVEPIFTADQRQALRRYQEMSSAESQVASNKLDKIIPAAFYGRVETLFVALGSQIWGEFEAGKGKLKLYQEYKPGSQDLLDLASIQTLNNSGQVYALQPGDMPDGAIIAAVFRYSYEG